MTEIIKVICIKSYTHVYRDYLHAYYTGSSKCKCYTKGKQYDMIVEESSDESSFYIVSDADTNTINDGIRFRFIYEKFSDYFIPLAEWREQQINSIFEDEHN